MSKRTAIFGMVVGAAMIFAAPFYGHWAGAFLHDNKDAGYELTCGLTMGAVGIFAVLGCLNWLNEKGDK